MTTLDELERLLKAGTPGPWKIERNKRCIQGPDTGEGDALVITSVMGGSKQWSASPYSQYCVPGMKDGDANAALIVAAINALPGLIESARRVEKLEAALKFYADPSRKDMPSELDPDYERWMFDASISEFFSALVEDEGAVEACARAMATEDERDPDGPTYVIGAMMPDRPVWRDYEAFARAVLRTLATRAQGESS